MSCSLTTRWMSTQVCSSYACLSPSSATLDLCGIPRLDLDAMAATDQ